VAGDKALIDAGPIIALFDRDDKYHGRAKKAISGFRGRLVTTWAMLAEVAHLLAYSAEVQMDFLEWLERGALAIENPELGDIGYIADRMKKYNDRPMDLADATLMCIAEKQGIRCIFSIDEDFSIYKTIKGKTLQNLL
jgi:predicted nucleic acid-binding protein